MKSRVCFSVGILFFSFIFPAIALSPDEIIAKHIQARGGLDAWNNIETMTIRGTYTGFSEPAPFTLKRKRPNCLYFDHMLGKRPVTIGFDGREAWWINTWLGIDWPIRMSPVDFNVVIQETDFATPFFDYKTAGHQIEYLGETEFEGQKVHKLKLIRKTGGEETWYLDPETYLEIARQSKGSDFGQELDQTSFFYDFRNINGLTIPFIVEHEFGIRHRMMEIDEIAFNEDIDDGIFAMPMPKGMDRIQSVLGHWDVEIQARRSPDAEFQLIQNTTAEIKSLANGGMFQETSSYAQGVPVEMIRHWSFDRYKDVYRLTVFNDFHKVIQVYEGNLADDVLQVDNLKTGTAFEERGVLRHDRFSFSGLGSDTWTMQRERTQDKGETWFADMKLTYTRKGKPTD